MVHNQKTTKSTLKMNMRERIYNEKITQDHAILFGIVTVGRLHKTDTGIGGKF